MTVSVQGPQVTDEIDAGPCEVFADLAAARAAAGKKSARRRHQLHQGAAVEDRVRHGSPSASASSSRACRQRRDPARRGSRGAAHRRRDRSGDPGQSRARGRDAVRAGQVLAAIAPRLSAGGDRASLDAEVLAARAELEAAEAQLARAERLFKEQAVPERNVEEARARANVARARLGAATGRLDQYSAGASGAGRAGQGAFQVRSPLDGTLVAASVPRARASRRASSSSPSSTSAASGSRRGSSSRTSPRSRAPAPPGSPSRATMTRSSSTSKNGKLVTVGRVIDPQSRTVPVIFEVANAEGEAPDRPVRQGEHRDRRAGARSGGACSPRSSRTAASSSPTCRPRASPSSGGR